MKNLTFLISSNFILVQQPLAIITATATWHSHFGGCLFYDRQFNPRMHHHFNSIQTRSHRRPQLGTWTYFFFLKTLWFDTLLCCYISMVVRRLLCDARAAWPFHSNHPDSLSADVILGHPAIKFNGFRYFRKAEKLTDIWGELWMWMMRTRRTNECTLKCVRWPQRQRCLFLSYNFWPYQFLNMQSHLNVCDC